MNHAECNVAWSEDNFYTDLIRTYGDSIYKAAYRITKNPEDAEDVLQDVFLRLLRKRKRVLKGDRWDLYLRRMAVNAAIDLLRKRARQQEIPLDEILAESIQNHCVNQCMQTAPDAILISKELQAQIQSKIAQLPKVEATVFILRHFEGLSYQEIAEATNSTKPVFRSKIFPIDEYWIGRNLTHIRFAQPNGGTV